MPAMRTTNTLHDRALARWPGRYDAADHLPIAIPLLKAIVAPLQPDTYGLTA